MKTEQVKQLVVASGADDVETVDGIALRRPRGERAQAGDVAEQLAEHFGHVVAVDRADLNQQVTCTVGQGCGGLRGLGRGGCGCRGCSIS